MFRGSCAYGSVSVATESRAKKSTAAGINQRCSYSTVSVCVLWQHPVLLQAKKSTATGINQRCSYSTVSACVLLQHPVLLQAKKQQPQVSIKGALTALCLRVCSCSTLCSYSTHRHVNTKNLPLTKRSTQCSQRVCHAAQTMDMAALAWR